MDAIHTASSSSSGSVAGRFRTCRILGIRGRCFLFRKVGDKLIGSEVSVTRISERRARCLIARGIRLCRIRRHPPRSFVGRVVTFECIFIFRDVAFQVYSVTDRVLRLVLVPISVRRARRLLCDGARRCRLNRRRPRLVPRRIVTATTSAEARDFTAVSAPPVTSRRKDRSRRPSESSGGSSTAGGSRTGTSSGSSTAGNTCDCRCGRRSIHRGNSRRRRSSTGDSSSTGAAHRGTHAWPSPARCTSPTPTTPAG